VSSSDNGNDDNLAANLQNDRLGEANDRPREVDDETGVSHEENDHSHELNYQTRNTNVFPDETNDRLDETPFFISSRYEIKRVIGSGAVGAVYEALDTSLGKLVAIKKLHSTSSPAEVIRFQREAQLAGSLKHPNVRTVLDFGLTSKNEPYLVLELAQGESVDDYLKTNGAMDLETALEIMLQVAAGLEHAHKHGIIHRDIKPSNVMLVVRDNQLVAQIVDFGIAKSQTSAQDLTSSGQGLGTPLFMSPEQIRGMKVDQRSDIYSFGCLLYKMLTGKPPFRGDTVFDTTDMHMNGPIPKLSDKLSTDFSDNIESIVRKTLAKKPDDRYSAVGEVATDLEKELRLIQNQKAESLAANQKLFEDAAPKYGNLDLPDAMKKAAEPKFNSPLVFGALGLCITIGIAVTLVWFLRATEDHAPPRPIKRPDPAINSFQSTEPFVYSKSGTWLAEPNATAADLAKLAKKNKNIERIDLSSSSYIPASALSVLRTQPLKFFILTDRDIDREILIELSKIPTLSRLRIGGKSVKIDTNSIDLLAANQQLCELTLYYVHVDDKLLVSLTKIKNLAYVIFESGRGLDSVNWELLRPLYNLKILIFNDSDVTDAALVKIARLPEVNTVGLKRTKISDAGIDTLCRMKKLKHVYLGDCPKVSRKAIKKLTNRGIEILGMTGSRERFLGIPKVK
jgi:serine/threonine protein kinase